MYMDEEDELVVMEKSAHMIKQAKQFGFEIGELELKSHKHEKKEDEE